MDPTWPGQLHACATSWASDVKIAHEKSFPILIMGESEVVRRVISISWQMENSAPPRTANVTGSRALRLTSTRGMPGGIAPRLRKSSDACANHRDTGAVTITFLSPGAAHNGNCHSQKLKRTPI